MFIFQADTWHGESLQNKARQQQQKTKRMTKIPANPGGGGESDIQSHVIRFRCLSNVPPKNKKTFE